MGVIDFQQAVETLRRTEEALRASYEDDVGNELRLVDEACALLLLVLTAVRPLTASLARSEAGELSGDIATLQLAAQTCIGIRTLRVIRAGRAVLAFGYEREAPALDRILLELMAHRRVILAKAVKRANERLAQAREAPLPDGLTPHSLRRTFASLLYAIGEPATVMMRSSDTRTLGSRCESTPTPCAVTTTRRKGAAEGAHGGRFGHQ